MKKSLILYTEMWPAVQKLSMEQRGKLFSAIMQQACGETPEPLDDLTDMVFMFVSSQIRRADTKYQETCRKRAEYGRRGGIASGKARAKQTKQNEAKRSYNENDNDYDNDNDNDNERDNEPDPDKENDNDNEALARRVLSLKNRELLEIEFGAERLAELVGDVEAWAASHGRQVLDWPAMIHTFARNQQRWQAAPRRDPMTAAIEKFMEDET